MSMTCKIAMDLAELYKEGIVSKESAAAIKQHLRECAACRRYYREYDQVRNHSFLIDRVLPQSVVSNAEAKGYAALSKKLRRRRYLQVAGTSAAIGVGSVMLMAGILLMRKGFLFEESK